MVRFRLLTGILNFITLIVAILNGFFLMFYCILCDYTYWYQHVLNFASYGALIIIFLICISVMAKEEIPNIMVILLYFISALYYLGLLIVGIYFAIAYNTTIVEQTTAIPATCLLLNLTLGLLYIFRDKIESNS